jgi:hypothetical protein
VRCLALASTLTLALAVATVGCATYPGTPEHRAVGGLMQADAPPPPGPWAVDALLTTKTCGTGSGLALTQVLRERGHLAKSTGGPTRLEVRCDWSSEDVLLWSVNTPRARGECTEDDVDSLRVHLFLTEEGPGAGARVKIGQAEFTGRLRLAHEPPHRGCIVRREPRESLLRRGIRSVVEALPAGADRPNPLVAPSPDDAYGVIVGTAGPSPPPVKKRKRSIYPMNVGKQPVPKEADWDPGGPSKKPHDEDLDEGVRVTSTYPEDSTGASAEARQSAWAQALQGWGIAMDLLAGACTDHCDTLYSPGLGLGLSVIYRPLALLALDAGMQRVSLETRHDVVSGEDVSPDSSTIHLGARLYLRPPGAGLQPYAGLAVVRAAVGEDRPVGESLVPLRFVGEGWRLRIGATHTVWGPVRIGAHGEWARVTWSDACTETGFLPSADGECDGIDEFHWIGGSDLWSAGLEVGVGYD